MNKFEYVWLDGYEPEPNLRSKVKIENYNGHLPEWSFDGSSTKQATGDNSDCILVPVAEYKTIDRIRPDATQTAPGLEGSYVMCEVLSANHEPHPSNTRTHCQNLISDDRVHRVHNNQCIKCPIFCALLNIFQQNYNRPAVLY